MEDKKGWSIARYKAFNDALAARLNGGTMKTGWDLRQEAQADAADVQTAKLFAQRLRKVAVKVSALNETTLRERIEITNELYELADAVEEALMQRAGVR